MSRWVVIVTALLARLLSALINYFVAKRGAEKEVKAEILKEEVVKQEEARVEAYREEKDVSGLSNSDLADRLRRRGDDWSRL